jgi:hypothetical protein
MMLGVIESRAKNQEPGTRNSGKVEKWKSERERIKSQEPRARKGGKGRTRNQEPGVKIIDSA